uniref:Endonuclease/exonuclease/phosphatase domain-containing protein n=1 Tax=Cacopsylla melanoneura TaxID=428564 RepID=A0A8D8XVC7_9HEMI
MNVCNIDLECLWFRCSLYGQELILCACYFPPPVKPDTINNFVESITANVDLYNSRLMFIGDFNIKEYIDPNTDTDRKAHINRLINYFNLESLNTILNKNNRTLDLCLSNFAQYNVTRNKCADIVVEKGQGLVKPVGHHPPLIINIELKRIPTYDSTQSSDIALNKSYNFKRANFSGLCNELQAINWQEVLNMSDLTNCNAKHTLFYNRIKNAIDKHVPTFSNVIKKQKFPLWWTHELKKLYKKKERLRKIKQKTAKQLNKYFELRKLCKKQIKINYEKYIESLERDLKENSSLFWNYFKDKKKETKKHNLKYKGNILKTPQETANAFARHFLNAHNHNIPKRTEYQNDATGELGPYLHIQEISEKELVDGIKNIPEKKAPGTDGLPPIFFKNCINQLKTPLTYLLNLSLRTSVFPDILICVRKVYCQ